MKRPGSARLGQLLAWLKAHKHEVILALCIITFVAYLGILGCLRQLNFISDHFDLGIMDQVVWNTAHGHIFQLTDPNGTATISRFAIHADPMLILLAPLYWVAASPYTLIITQIIIMGLGALPLYWLGRRVIGNKTLALVIAISYLLFPPMQRAAIFDFHAVALETAFIIFAFYYLYRRKYWGFALFALLILLCKETACFVVISLGLYAIIAQRNWRVGLAAIGFAAGWFYLLLWYIIPSSRTDGLIHFALSYYAQLGSTPSEVIKNVFVKPWLWINQLWSLDQLKYLGYFFLPTGLLPLLSPVLLLAVPEFAINMLSSNTLMHSYAYQYTSDITPFVFIAMVFGVTFVRRKWWPWLDKRFPPVAGKLDWLLVGYLAVCAIAAIWLWAPFPGARDGNVDEYFISQPAGPYLNRLAEQIPVSASVSATARLEPHFSERQHVYAFPLMSTQADYVITQEGFPFEQVPPEEISKAIRQMEQNKDYELIYHNGAVEVFKRH